MAKLDAEYPQIQVDRDLSALIRASYKLLYVVSWEERRVILSLSAICGASGMAGVHVWDSSRGMVEFTPQSDEDWGPVPGGDALRSPEQAIDYIIAKAQDFNAMDDASREQEPRGPVFVLCDIFRYIGAEAFVPEIERKLKILPDLLCPSSMSVVLLSPVLVLPTALEKSVTVIDYPLPGPDHLVINVREAKNVISETKGLSAKQAASLMASEESVVKALLGLTLSEADSALAKSYIVKKKFHIPTLLEIKRQIIRKGELLEFVYSDSGLESVGGFVGLKDFIRLRKNAFTNKAKKYGLPSPKGIFMLGVAGCGKSLAAKAISSELEVPLLKMDIGKLLGMYVGESEANTKRALQSAESVAPCCLFVDEIDKALSSNNDNSVVKRIIAQLLEWMAEKTSPVFVIAAANSLEGLPPALLRKGRFDALFFVDLPSALEREAIFGIHIAKNGRRPDDYDLKELAKKTDGFSGAEIEGVVIDAMFLAFGDGEREFTTDDVVAEVVRCVPLSLTMGAAVDTIRTEAKGRMRRVDTPLAAAQQPTRPKQASGGRFGTIGDTSDGDEEKRDPGQVDDPPDEVPAV